MSSSLPSVHPLLDLSLDDKYEMWGGGETLLLSASAGGVERLTLAASGRTTVHTGGMQVESGGVTVNAGGLAIESGGAMVTTITYRCLATIIQQMPLTLVTTTTILNLPASLMYLHIT